MRGGLHGQALIKHAHSTMLVDQGVIHFAAAGRLVDAIAQIDRLVDPVSTTLYSFGRRRGWRSSAASGILCPTESAQHKSETSSKNDGSGFPEQESSQGSMKGRGRRSCAVVAILGLVRHDILT